MSYQDTKKPDITDSLIYDKRSFESVEDRLGFTRKVLGVVTA